MLFLNLLSQFYLNNVTNLLRTVDIMPDNMQIVT